MSTKVTPRPRRNEGPWTPSPEQAERVRQAMARADVTDERCLRHGGRSTPVRPTVAVLLRHLCDAGGAPVPVADVCDAVYGRPATLRAVRQTAFRSNRAMERVDCSLTVCCRGGRVFVRLRVRTFESRPHVAPVSAGSRT